MVRQASGPMDLKTAGMIVVVLAVVYSAWLTSIAFSAAHGHRSLMIASAAFFPVGIVHGIGIWLGGW